MSLTLASIVGTGSCIPIMASVPTGESYEKSSSNIHSEVVDNINSSIVKEREQ